MGKRAILAKVTCRPGARDDVAAVFDSMIGHVREGNEPGTQVYGMHADRDDEDVLWFYELYRDRDALQAHAQSATMAELLRRLDGLLAEPPQLTRLDPVAAVGIPV